MEDETIDDINFNEINNLKGNPIHFAAIGVFLYLSIQILSNLFIQFLSDIIINAGTYKLSNLIIISALKLIFILIVLFYLKNKIKNSLIIKKKSTISIFRSLIILLIVAYLLKTGYSFLSPTLFLSEVSEIGGFGHYDSNLYVYNMWLTMIEGVLTIVIYALVLMTDKDLRLDKK